MSFSVETLLELKAMSGRLHELRKDLIFYPNEEIFRPSEIFKR